MNCRDHSRMSLAALALFVLCSSKMSWAQTITLLSPNSAQTRAVSRTELIVFGRDFTKSHAIFWKGRALPTKFISATKLTSSVPPSYIDAEGTAEVTVGDEYGMSDPATFTISSKPVPTLTNLAPSSVKAGGAGFRLSVVGTNLPRLAVIQWNLSDRATNYFSTLAVDAAISASDIAFPGVYDVLLIDTGLSDAVTNALTVTVMVNSPPPVIESLNPARVEAGYIPFSLQVTGRNFTPTSVVRWNGADRETQFVDTNTLFALISDTDVSNPSQAEITVMETAPGGAISNKVNLPVVTTNAAIFPQFVAGGGYSTTLTIVNIGTVEVKGSLSLFDKEGSPFFGIVQNDDPLKPLSAVPIALASGSMRVFKIDKSQTTQSVSTGWAKVDSVGGFLQGNATVQYRSSGTVRNSSTVTNWVPLPYAEIPIDNDMTEDRFTGFTVANSEDAEINLKVAVYDQDGKLIQVLTPLDLNPLKPRAQVSKFIHEYFPAANATFKGSMVLFSPDYRNFVIVGLVQSQGLLSIIPALPGPYFALPQ